MLRLREHTRVDVTQRHIVHRALIGQVGAVLVVTHTDGGTGSILVLTDEETRVYAFLLQAGLHQVAEAVVANHAAESDLGSQRSGIGREDGRRTA